MGYEEARYKIASAVYRLLLRSNAQEWFQADIIAREAGLNIGSAFVKRVAVISSEEDEVFQLDDNDFISLGREGFELATKKWVPEVSGAASESAPASDRMVRFDHNDPVYDEIREQIKQVKEDVRATNDVNAEERDRVVAQLSAAEALWQSVELRLINLKSGVLLAAEDAAKLLLNTSKAVAAALLVDTIKAFVKAHTGIDLDRI